MFCVYEYMHVPTFYKLTNFQEILCEYNAIVGLLLVNLRLTGAWQTTVAPLNPLLGSCSQSSLLHVANRCIFVCVTRHVSCQHF